MLRRPGRALASLPDPPAQPPVHIHAASRPGLGARTKRADLRRPVADAPRLDRQCGVRSRPQRAVRPERSARLLRPLSPAPITCAVHLHGTACPNAVGNPPDETPRRLSPAAHPATAPRRGGGRNGMRTNRAGGQGPGLAPRPPSGSIAYEGPRHRRPGAVPYRAGTESTIALPAGHASARDRRDAPHPFRQRADAAEASVVADRCRIGSYLVEASAARAVTKVYSDAHLASSEQFGQPGSLARSTRIGLTMRTFRLTTF